MRWLELIVAVLWLATGASLATRTYFVFNYAAYANLPPALELIGVPVGVLPILLLSLGVVFLVGRVSRSSELAYKSNWGKESTAYLLAASFPLWMSVLGPLGVDSRNALREVGLWEPIGFAVLSGLAVYRARASGSNSTEIDFGKVFSVNRSLSLVCVAATLCGIWWFLQAKLLFDSFQLGFNDFGHFLLRVIHTARGQGLLIEAPFLPTFWDHFNPGLVFLVPLWKLYPGPELVFALQAAALAVSAVLVYSIALKHGSDPQVATIWGLAWLVYPSVGQMNVAYTYGWHPITFSIPSLLGAYLLLERRRYLWAILLAVLACSFEEGAIVAVGCFAMARAIMGWVDQRRLVNRDGGFQGSEISPGRWMVIWCVSVLGFIAVYRWSGLAEFQTGRFAKLGASAIEICFSPILRPAIFFELLFRGRNFAFLVLLFAPFVVLLLSRRFYWTVIAVSPLLVVLFLWEHMPAQSLAFQYASVILPILFVGAIETSELDRAMPRAASVLLVGGILSIYFGQLPWSGDTLLDVKSRTYPPGAGWTRSLGSRDNQVFHEQVQSIRRLGHSQSLAFEQCRVLATGRLAGHFLGAKELETVGQYAQRYADYVKLDPELESPLLRYDLILLDRVEEFQQTKEQTQSVLDQALALGFETHSQADGFQVLKRGQ